MRVPGGLRIATGGSVLLTRGLRLFKRQLAPVEGFRSPHLPDWRTIIGRDPEVWKKAQKAKGPNVLVALSHGKIVPLTVVEAATAAALTLRGAKVHVLLCDHALPACQMAERHELPDVQKFIETGPPEGLCKACFDGADTMFRDMGLTVHRYSDLLTPQDRAWAAEQAKSQPVEAIPTFELEGVTVGEHALAGALRFFARGNLQGLADGEPVLRRYFEAALITAMATQRLLRQVKFECVSFNHGLYVPQGIIGGVCRRMGVRVVNWNPAYRKKSFIFSHGDTYHHTLMSEPVSNWESMPWSPEMEEAIMAYLKSRWQGTEDWIWFHEKPTEDMRAIAQEMNLDLERPIIGMLTNVMWDAQLHYPANAFPNMLDWVLQTIEYFAKRPDLQLLVRIHPAEIRGTTPSQQPLAAEITKAFPQLPPNVHVLPPENRTSTYAAMALCNSAIIYGTKMGVELTSTGMPVIVAGEAWIRNKGITNDAKSIPDYFRRLDALPFAERMSPEQTQRARKYAYHFFFRRMIPLACMEPTPGTKFPYNIRIERITELAPGADPGMDVVTQGILTGSEFIYPAERQAAPAAAAVASA